MRMLDMLYECELNDAESGHTGTSHERAGKQYWSGLRTGQSLCITRDIFIESGQCAYLSLTHVYGLSSIWSTSLTRFDINVAVAKRSPSNPMSYHQFTAMHLPSWSGSCST